MRKIVFLHEVLFALKGEGIGEYISGTIWVPKNTEIYADSKSIDKL